MSSFLITYVTEYFCSVVVQLLLYSLQHWHGHVYVKKHLPIAVWKLAQVKRCSPSRITVPPANPQLTRCGRLSWLSPKEPAGKESSFLLLLLCTFHLMEEGFFCSMSLWKWRLEKSTSTRRRRLFHLHTEAKIKLQPGVKSRCIVYQEYINNLLFEMLPKNQ